MVKEKKPARILLLIPLLAALLLFSPHAATAQGLGEEGGFTLSEELRIEINEVGDAHITDVIEYDQAWFDEYGYLFEENPNLLSRRYRSDSNVGEVEDFDVDINARKATITISFDTPGLAYYLSGGWTVFGYGNRSPVRESDDELVLEAAWTLNNEWTLFEPMELEERVIIDLPAGAQEAHFDEDSGALTYRLPVAETGKGFLAAHKTMMIIIFSLLMALSFLLLLYLFTRRPASGRPAAVTPSIMPPAAPGTTPPVMEGAGKTQTEGTGIPGQEAGVSAPTPSFCSKCGYPRASAQERFCRKCGAPHG